MNTLLVSKNIFWLLGYTLGLFLCVAVGSTQAYFNDDTNQADAGAFAVGNVSASITADPTVVDIEADTASMAELSTADTSTIATQSRLTFTPQSCRADFYNELLLEVTTASGTTASNFASSSITQMDVPTGYTLAVAPSPDFAAAANENCVITATLETWQADFSDATTGFSSTDTTTFTLRSTEAIGPQETSSVVLNELYPAVLSTTTEPLEREWVELYNGTDSAVDVAGWRIDEYIGGTILSGSRPHTIVGSCASVTASDHMQPFDTTDTVIPAGGFLVVEFCGSASYMADGGDTIELYNAAVSQVDTHTYPATTNGKSHARIPDGAAWVDPVPTPGNKNNATRADLEAEGWDEETIESTLAVLATEGAEAATSSSIQATDMATSSGDINQVSDSDTSEYDTPSTTSGVRPVASTTALASSTSTTSPTIATGTDTVASSGTTSSTILGASSTTATGSSSDTQVPLTDMPLQPAATTTKPAVPEEEGESIEVLEESDPPDEVDSDTTDDADSNDDVVFSDGAGSPATTEETINEETN